MSNPNIGNLPFSDTSDSDNSQENTTAAQENSTTDIATTSAQENPTTDGNVEPPPNFVVKLNQARTLKFAIEAICDPEINPLGLGRIDADVNGFSVTVQNSSNNVVAHLCFKTSDFSCNKAIEDKIINLHELDKKLAVLGDDRGCTITQDEENVDITFFAFGPDQVSVPLLENDAEIPKFLEMSHFCKVVVPSFHFDKMLTHLLQQPTPEVLVEIAENNFGVLMLTVKIEDSWKKDYPMLKAAGSRGVEPEKSYSASFQWTDAQWLNKASDKDTTVEVSLHMEPFTYIALSFKIKGMGYLKYVKIPIT